MVVAAYGAPDIVDCAALSRRRRVRTRQVTVAVCRHCCCRQTRRTEAEPAFSQPGVWEAPATTLVHAY